MLPRCESEPVCQFIEQTHLLLFFRVYRTEMDVLSSVYLLYYLEV